MATTTATIFIGQTHPNHSGIESTHFIEFRENDKPHIILRDMECKEEKKIFIPTIENTIEDIYLIIAVYVLKKITSPKPLESADGLNFYEITTDDERNQLYKNCLEIFRATKVKLVFNLFENCHLLTQLDRFNELPADFEITTPLIKKEFNVWTQKIETKRI